MKLQAKHTPAELAAKALAELAAAVRELPPRMEGSAKALCPIFGDGPRPPQPSVEGLPPGLAAASLLLGQALSSPPSLDDQWPFANPPAVQALIDKQRAGRPPKVTPHAVIRLVRYVKLGHSMDAAAKRIGIGRSMAFQILAGQHAAAHSEAVRAAGVTLPPQRPREAVQKGSKNSPTAQGGAQVAIRGSSAPKARKSDSGQNGGAAA